ncbi:FadR/GntR family transcriptional regulator [Oceanobacillus profundus]|nr:FadR/GntR family transcriptional regulator [Oceanobacillus profundus]
MLKPIRRKRLYQDIIEQIQLLIRDNELKPGDKLPSEREMAENLSVSRTSVREAISVMESAGLVEVLQGKGVFLINDENTKLLNKLDKLLNSQGLNLIELIEVRQGLEGQAAYLAAIRRSETDLQKIKSAYIKMEKAYANDLVAAEEDYEFHISVVTAAKNPMLLKAVELFTDPFIQGVNILREKSIKSGKGQIILSEHFDIYKAIEEQDELKAQTAMWNHLVAAKKRYFIDS